MKIKNYTSSVPADRSISAIERLLVDGGASHISKVYESQTLTGLTFEIFVPDQNRSFIFKLPSKTGAVEKLMMAEIRRPRGETLRRVKDQAERTAWKILHDWVAVQISMIRLQQAEFLEIFMPYLFDRKTQRTLFQSCKETNFKQITQG